LPEKTVNKNKAKKTVYFILGIITLVLSYVGIIMPGIPAIPFILLTLWLFLRSSDKLYNWFMSQKLIKKLAGNFIENKKTSVFYRLFIVSQLWVSIVVCMCIFVSDTWWRIFVSACGVTMSIAFFRLTK